MTRAKFAKLRGLSRSRVTQLAQAGRLVLNTDGKLVAVEESIRRLDETMRAGRMAGSSARRGEKLAQAPGSPEGGAELRKYNAARARREEAAAESAEIALRARRAELVEISEVRELAARLAGIIALGFEGIPARVGPVWSAADNPGDRERLLREELDRIRAEWADAIAALVRGGMQTSAQPGDTDEDAQRP